MLHFTRTLRPRRKGGVQRKTVIWGTIYQKFGCHCENSQSTRLCFSQSRGHATAETGCCGFVAIQWIGIHRGTRHADLFIKLDSHSRHSHTLVALWKWLLRNDTVRFVHNNKMH